MIKIKVGNNKNTLYIFDFDDTIRDSKTGKELECAKILKDKQSKGLPAIILTGNPETTFIEEYLKKHKFKDIEILSSFGIEKQDEIETSLAKKKLLKKYLKDKSFSKVYFYDDQEDNLEKIKQLEDELNIKVYTKKPK